MFQKLEPGVVRIRSKECRELIGWGSKCGNPESEAQKYEALKA